MKRNILEINSDYQKRKKMVIVFLVLGAKTKLKCRCATFKILMFCV